MVIVKDCRSHVNVYSAPSLKSEKKIKREREKPTEFAYIHSSRNIYMGNMSIILFKWVL